jgi:glycerol-3-phosphate acyltransferase PlsY
LFRFLLLAYLIGSIPNAYLFARWFGGRDIRQLGSQNAGAANVVVNVGWLPGVLTLLGDVGKGYLAALIGGFSFNPLLPFLAPACAIAGHNWPIWLRFRGGGGLATFVGGCLALSDGSLALAALTLWGLLYLVCHDHDRSAVLACILMPCAVLVAEQSTQIVAFISSSSMMILLRRLQSISERVRRHVEGHVSEHV